MHEIGHSFRADRIRDGVVTTVYELTTWDFERQTPRWAVWELLPGDTLRVHCVYDSSQRAVATPGGSSSETHEMCHLFMVYTSRHALLLLLSFHCLFVVFLAVLWWWRRSRGVCSPGDLSRDVILAVGRRNTPLLSNPVGDHEFRHSPWVHTSRLGLKEEHNYNFRDNS